MGDSARPLLVLGTRTLAVEVADLACEIDGFEVAGFVENMDRRRCAERLEGLPIYWVDEAAKLAESHSAVCGLATTFRSRFTEQVAALRHEVCYAGSPLGQGLVDQFAW